MSSEQNADVGRNRGGRGWSDERVGQLVEPVWFVAMPWTPVDQPSIQIGVLSSRLRQAGIPTSALYANLEFVERVGLDFYVQTGTYHNLWSDWVFSEELFGAFRPPQASAYDDFLSFAGSHGFSETDIQEMIRIKALIPSFLTWCTEAVAWESVRVVGFSTTTLQTTASLALAKRLRSAFPHLVILFGGASCQGVMGRTLLRAFPFVDGVVDGEADETIAAIMGRILTGSGEMDGIPGISWRSPGGSLSYGVMAPAANMGSYPIPDHSRFFEQLRTHSVADSIDLRIPFEGSRGCWWGVQRLCKFCGSNGQIITQRVRPAHSVVAELKTLRNNFGVSLFVATDNIIASPHITQLPPALRSELPNVNLFFEMRARMTRKNLVDLASAGVKHIQVGIESLIPEVLTMIDKGTTPIANLCFLRRTSELGIREYWNLIYGFPGEDTRWYETMLNWLPLVYHLRPPDAVRYSLMRFSPYFEDPSRYGIEITGPLPGTEYIWNLPVEDIRDLSYALDFELPGKGFDDHVERAVRAAVLEWTESLAVLESSLLPNERVIVRDTRPGMSSDQYVLSFNESVMLRSFERPRSADEAVGRLLSSNPDIYLRCGGASSLHGALQSLLSRGLVFHEGTEFLALPVPQSPRYWLDAQEEQFDVKAAPAALVLPS